MGNQNQARKPAPEGWPRISSAVFYEDAAAAIDWLCSAFGFAVRLRIAGEGGRIEHSELVFGEGLIMVGSSGGKSTRADPPAGHEPACGRGRQHAKPVCLRG